jgi:hypothetical protein
MMRGREKSVPLQRIETQSFDRPVGSLTYQTL